MLDECILLFAFQSFAKTRHTFVAAKREHVDEFFNVETGGAAGCIGTANAWLSEIEGLCIIDAVLQGIAPVIGRSDHYAGQLRYIDVKTDVEIVRIAHRANGIPGSSLAEIRKPDGI